MPVHICKMLKTVANHLLHFCECQNTLLSQNSRIGQGQISKSYLHSMMRPQLTEFSLFSQSLILSLRRRLRKRSPRPFAPSHDKGGTPHFDAPLQPCPRGFQQHPRLADSLSHTQVQAGVETLSFRRGFFKRLCFVLHFLPDLTEPC